MDITIYLPDELGRWAKESGLNLSQALRAEVERERRRRTAAPDDSEALMLPVKDRDGRSYTVRFHGVPLNERRSGVLALIGENDALYVHSERDHSFDEFPADGTRSRAEWLRDLLDDDEDYIEAMSALGEAAVVDVGQPAGS